MLLQTRRGAIALLVFAAGLASSTSLAEAQPATCGGRTATIVGTAKADVIKGTSGDDVIVALGGKDKIDGGKGDDIICGGRGNDRIKGGAGNDVLYGEAGNDRLIGGNGVDSLYGGPGRDKLKAGRANDGVLDGGPGKDKVDGGKGDDFGCVASPGDKLKRCENAFEKPEPKPKGNSQLGEGPFRFVDGGHSWDVTISQIVALPLSEFSDGTGGDCYAILGAATLLDLPDGQLASHWLYAPEVALIDTTGTNLDTSIFECEDSSIREAGYDWRLDVAITRGTKTGFFEVFRSDAAPLLATVGQPQSPSGIYDAIVSTEVDPAPAVAGPLAGKTAQFGVDTFSYENDDNTWTVRLDEIISVPVSDFDFQPQLGQCFAVVGTATLESLGEGVVSGFLDGPRAGFVDTRGRSTNSETSCDWASLEDSGAVWELDVEVTEGTTVRFFSTFRTPAQPAYATIGDPSDPTAVYSLDPS